MRLFYFFIAFLIVNLSYSQGLEMQSYKFGDGLRFVGESGESIRLTGYAQPMSEFKQTEGNERISRYRMRRLRLRVDGQTKDPRFKYRLQVDLSGVSEAGDADENPLMDAYIDYAPNNSFSVKFGQRTTYADNRELWMSSNSLQLVERSRLTLSLIHI